MYRWNSFPFLRFVLVYALGILCARFYIHPADQAIWYIMAGVIFFVIAIIGHFKHISFYLVGTLLLVSIFLLGVSRFLDNDLSENTDVTNQKLESSIGFVGQVVSYPSSRTNYDIYEIKTQSCVIDSSLNNLPTNLLLYVKRNAQVPLTLSYGDWIGVKGTPLRISRPKNPYEFDFAALMKDQNIYFQLFSEAQDIELLATQKGNPILSAVYYWRHRFETIIQQNIKGENERAIAQALLLGIKDDLDTEIKSSYAAAGAMHVLAVSGLHVGILYFLILALFKLVPDGSFKQIALPLISIILLWIYALLTGFSPSILRAVTMFTMVILGKSIGRGSNIYNSLSFSAFILLVLNPANLFSIGFQLSYLAVIGIVILYDKIYSFWVVNSYIGNLLWQWTCLSIAAQIATTPISIYYFHQFPTYFLAANLLVIPAAFVIMFIGFAMLIFSFSDLFWWIGWILEQLIYGLNRFTLLIYQLPHSLLNWLYISALQTWLIYLLIISILCFLILRKYRWLYFSFVCALLISADSSIHMYLQSKSEEITFYHIRKNHLFDYIKGLDAQLMTIDTANQSAAIQYQISPHRLHRFLPKPDSAIGLNDYQIGDFAQLAMIDNRRIIFLTKRFDSDQIHFKIDTDYLVVSNNVVNSTDQINAVFTYKTLIIDHSNRKKIVDQIQQEFATKESECLNMNEFALLLDWKQQNY